MTHIKVTHPLDWGEHYHLNLDYDTTTGKLAGALSGPVGSTGIVERHLIDDMLMLKSGGTLLPLENTKPASAGSRTFATQLPAGSHPGIEILLGQKTPSEDADPEPTLFGHVHFGLKGVEEHTVSNKLTVFETRMLGNERIYRKLPYSRKHLVPSMLQTDLHTHSSGQISAQGLIDIGQGKGVPDATREPPEPPHAITYPTRLLDQLHITYNKDDVIEETPRFYFQPKDGDNPDIVSKTEPGIMLDKLSDKAIKQLKAALAIPPDQLMTFGDVEQTVYQYRYPIAKHPDVAYAMWHKVAQEYQAQGVTYAEITAASSSFLTAQNVAFLHKALPLIEEDTHVKLRFLAGIPRGLPPSMMAREITKIKLMGKSPYIVGVDFIGFEDNKIEALEPSIRSLGEWSKQNDRSFTLRIHAGENRKNITNVTQSLRIAKDYGMRVRIGHAAHGLDGTALALAEELARDGLVMIEFNPDSNMALNNIDRAEDLDMLRCLQRNIPFVICSDGSGLYQTDTHQLWSTASFAASFAGVERTHFASIMKTEAEHILEEQERFDRKMEKLPANFLKDIAAGYTALGPSPATPSRSNDGTKTGFEARMKELGIVFDPASVAAATKDKVPLMILGASGERYWNMISPEQKEQIKIGLDGLVEQLNPNKVYFVVGRPKNAGITQILSEAVQHYNNTHKEGATFSLVSATVQADQTTKSFTPGLTHVIPLNGTFFDVPKQLVDTVKQHKDGHILFIGGGTFVRDAILVAQKQGVAFGLMKGPEGASTEKSRMMDKSRRFLDGQGMIDHIHQAHPKWFKLNEREPSSRVAER